MSLSLVLCTAPITNSLVQFAELKLATVDKCSSANCTIESHAHTVVWECCKDDQQNQWEMLKFDPQLPLNPLSDRHQIWHAWLRHGYISPRKIGPNPLRGFFSPYTRNIHPDVRYATPYVDACLLLFTARCYSSAVLAMGVCLSVCLSQVGVLLKRLG